jgi:protein-tyrosine phosphatase
MIDLHCHILPGLDDGSPDIAESLAMIDVAVQDGIDTVVCTPHALDGVHNNDDPEAIRKAVGELEAEARSKGINIRLVAGADIHISPDMAQRFKEGRLSTVNGTNYFLLELPHNMVPPGIETALFDWQVAGLIPILTHPERNAELGRDLPRIVDLVQRGVLMQVTADSLTGAMGGEAEQSALAMLEACCVHFIASDAHSSTWRKPVLSAARDRVAQTAGPQAALAMVQDNPRLVLEGKPVPIPDPFLPQAPRKKSWLKFWRR